MLAGSDRGLTAGGEDDVDGRALVRIQADALRHRPCPVRRLFDADGDVMPFTRLIADVERKGGLPSWPREPLHSRIGFGELEQRAAGVAHVIRLPSEHAQEAAANADERERPVSQAIMI